MLGRVLAATVAGGIAFFILGFLIYGMVLDPLVMRPNTTPEALKLMKDPPTWVFLILGNLVAAFLLAYIFDKWATIRTFVGGVTGGAVIFFIIALYFQLMFAAFMNMTNGYMPAVVDVIGTTILGGLSGGVVGLVLGMMNKDAAGARA
jgi:hypothetical protein